MQNLMKLLFLCNKNRSVLTIQRFQLCPLDDVSIYLHTQSASVAAAYAFHESQQFALYTDSMLDGFSFTIHPALDT